MAGQVYMSREDLELLLSRVAQEASNNTRAGMQDMLNQLQQRQTPAQTQSAAPRLRDPRVHPYAGIRCIVDLNTYLSKLEEYFQLFGIAGEDQRLLIAAYNLEGVARLWLQTLREEDRPTTWQHFKTALRKQFEPANAILDARNRLRKLTQNSCGGSVKEYTEKFWGLVLELGTELSESERLDRYVAGLRRSHQLAVYATHPRVTTLSEAIRMVTARGDIIAHTQMAQPPLPDGPQPMELGSRDARKGRRCFNCNEVGHIASVCPRRQRNRKEPEWETRLNRLEEVIGKLGRCESQPEGNE